MTAHKIAVIGGTGPLGKGLGYRFANAGHTVAVGSRDPGRAHTTAAEITSRIGGSGSVVPADNMTAAASADIAVMAIPYAGHGDAVQSLTAELTEKIAVSCANPRGFDKHGPYGLHKADGRSAAEELQQVVPNAKVVGAFHHLAAAPLWTAGSSLEHEDVLVCGDDAEAKGVVIELAAAVTRHAGVDAGALRLARRLEPLTAVLISINKRYKIRSGIRVAGFSHDEATAV